MFLVQFLLLYCSPHPSTEYFLILFVLLSNYTVGILAELYTLRPLFPGSSEADEIYKICSILGKMSVHTSLTDTNTLTHTFEGVWICYITHTSFEFIQLTLLCISF